MSQDRRRRDLEFADMVEQCIADDSEIEVRSRDDSGPAAELVVRSRQTDYVYKVTITPTEMT